MNKYLASVLLAAACLSVVSASPIIGADDDVESQLSLTPSNDEETAALEGTTSVFSDFCIQSRDFVIGDIKTRSNGMAGNLFSIFFNGAENLGLEAVNVQREAAERLGNQIRHPDAPIGDYDESNEVDSIVADGQRRIQESSSQPRNLFQGVVSALAATKNVVTSKVLSKLDDIKSSFGIATVTNALRDACNRVAEYDQQLTERFEQARSELAAHDASIASIPFEKVGCVTVRRVIRLDGLCKFAMAAQNPLIKAITYRPMPSNQ